MDLHALTSKPEITDEPSEIQEVITPIKPAIEPVPSPVVYTIPPASESESPVTAVQSETKGEIDMVTESNTTSKPKVHDSTFWEVHLIVVYYIILIALNALLLLYVWGGDMLLLKQLGLTDKAIADPFLRTVGYTVVGGVFGSVLYNIRVLFYYYLRKGSYDPRWLGKYISAPWESAAMSVVVLTLVRGGAALFGGASLATVAAPPTPTNNFASFSMGALVGFGMRDVVRWVQALVETTFGALTKGKNTSTENELENEE